MKENIIIALLLILVALFAYIALHPERMVLEDYLDLKGYSVSE